jgi:hypothetical protein
MTVRVVLLLLALNGFACAPPSSAFGPTSFRSPNGDYQIEYSQRAQQLLIDDNWTVQNYRYGYGAPEALTKGDFVSQSIWVMPDGSRRRIRTATYELLLEHVTNATIWVRLVPLPERVRSKEIRFLAENYVNNLTGSFYSDSLEPQLGERRISAKILSSDPLSVIDYAARRVRFEVVNLDQLEHDPNAPRETVEVVIVKGPFQIQTIGTARGAVPAVLVLGYANGAAEFDKLYPDFTWLLQNVQHASEQP